ncbi:MAG: tetratricopeptide repeat protein [Candidatus Omnitrophota bacterium]|jgi:tetratricopeptide (TPR) repeat protein|nr:MAG: tetratricopeptide repeat protein [Candidatus Omnitrophota bacterium]
MIKKYHFPLFVLVLFLVLPFIPCAENEERDAVQQLMNHAWHELDRYQFAQAAEWFQKAIEMNDAIPDAHLGLAKALIGQQKTEEAKDELLKVIEYAPTHAEALTMIGIYYQHEKQDFPNAEKYLQKAIQCDSAYIRPRKILGEIYTELHRYDEAVAVYQEIIRRFPSSADGFYGLGKVLLNQKQLEESEKALLRAVELTPRDPEPHLLLARVYAGSSRRDQAKQEQVAYQELKKAEEYFSELQKALRRSPEKADLWFAVGAEYLKRGEFPRACESFEHGLERNPQNAKVHSVLGALYLREKNVPRARTHLEAAIRIQANNADDYNNLGVCLLMQEQYEDAIYAFENAIKLGKDDPHIRKNLHFAIEKHKQNTPSP